MTMSNDMSNNQDFDWSKIVGAVVVCAVLIGGIFVSVAYLSDWPEPLVVATPTPALTATPTTTPIANPTPTPTATVTPTPTPTTAPTASPTPSPTPTPSPDATAFQNTSLTYGGYVDQMVNWIANGTIVDTVTHTGLSGLTVSVVSASNSSLVYGNVTTGVGGYFELTFAVMEPPTVQFVFAGNGQYLAITSDAIELPPA
jgi:hypothetical protein